LIQWLLVLTLPIALVAVDLRILTGHWFVRWEYGKASFPPDPFGLTTDERIRLAQVCDDYLSTNAERSLLADLQLPSGEPAFNERELQHMADVQAVYHSLTIAGIIAALVWLGGVGALLSRPHTRHMIPTALMKGSLLILGLLVVVGAFMALSWGEFFTAFHRLFFEGDSWIFPNSDTLIRLFPIRFWMDVAATMVVLLVVEAIGIGLGGWLWKRRQGTEVGPPNAI
jgi:integral membrane protein (TIGR01906 family)